MQEKEAKINAQGLSRRDESLMRSLVADEGELIVSSDISAAEPSIISHFSKDRRFTYCAFGGVGKEPYYEDKILMTDDIYLTSASVSPVGQDVMEEAYHRKWGGVSFSEQWVIDKEVIKSDPDVKAIRKFHKPLVLGIGYGMGAQKMVDTAADSGLKLRLEDAKAFHRAYWYSLYPDVRKLGERLKLQNKSQGYITNVFGFRLFPSLPKTLNYFIQSSTSGVMDLIAITFYKLAPWAKHHCILHDEAVYSIPKDKVDETKKALKLATDHVNKQLGWDVDIRVGFVSGKDYFDAH